MGEQHAKLELHWAAQMEAEQAVQERAVAHLEEQVDHLEADLQDMLSLEAAQAIPELAVLPLRVQVVHVQVELQHHLIVEYAAQGQVVAHPVEALEDLGVQTQYRMS